MIENIIVDFPDYELLDSGGFEKLERLALSQCVVPSHRLYGASR